MGHRIDLNCDMGESFGAYVIGRDDTVVRYVTSASVACGFHAGDPVVMRSTVRLAKKHGVSVGAHPGYPDLMGFGRRNMCLAPHEVRDYLTYQIGALRAFCDSEQIQLQHVKPHGALYNMAVDDPDLTNAVIESLKDFRPEPIVLVLAKSVMQEICEKAGVRVAKEAFADRAYSLDGRLVPRNVPGAVVKDPALIQARVIRMVKQQETLSTKGETVGLGRVDSICVHGDNPEAVNIAVSIRSILSKERVEVVPLKEFV